MIKKTFSGSAAKGIDDLVISSLESVISCSYAVKGAAEEQALTAALPTPTIRSIALTRGLKTANIEKMKIPLVPSAIFLSDLLAAAVWLD